MMAKHVAFHLFFPFCIYSLMIVFMLGNVRVLNSNRATSVSPKASAYLYRYMGVDCVEYRVIIADSPTLASQYLRDWCIEQGVDMPFFHLVDAIDFEVVGETSEYCYKKLL